MCKDASLTLLNKQGYNAVRLPRENIDPLQLIAKTNGSLERLGFLNGLLLNESPVPQVVRDQKVATITGERTAKFDIKGGLTLLKRILSAMGVGEVGLEATYNKAHTIQFEFENVLSDSVDMILVGRYLAHAQLDLSNPILDNINEEGEAFVVSETLKSNSFGVIASDRSGATIDVDVAGIQKILDVNTHVRVARGVARKVSFKGQGSLRFAFKASPILIRIENGDTKISLSPPSGLVGPLDASMVSGSEPRHPMFGKDTLLRLK